jgi:putative transposase
LGAGGDSCPSNPLIHDRDRKFSDEFDAALRAQGLDVVVTPFRSPRANAVCERVLGSLRGECLDWLIVLGERHLMRILCEYFEHYNRSRPHRALELQPRPDHCLAVGEIACIQRHGLINDYSRAA